MADPGTVYVIFNDRAPYQVKVGRTTKTTEKRAIELRTTGVLGQFVVAYDVFVDDPVAVERAVHEALADSRSQKDREFFACGPKPAINALLRAAHGHLMAPPWVDEEVELLPQLKARFASLLDPKLTSVVITVRDDGVVLRSSFKNWDMEVSTIETNLGFVGSDDEPTFPPEASAQENAGVFLTFYAIDLAHCTPLLRHDVTAEDIGTVDDDPIL